VFQLARTDIQNSDLPASERSPLHNLHIKCLGEFAIHAISLRATRDLHVDFEEHQKNFSNNNPENFAEKFFWTPWNLSFEELSRSLSKPSEGFDRSVYPRKMGSTGNRGMKRPP